MRPPLGRLAAAGTEARRTQLAERDLEHRVQRALARNDQEVLDARQQGRQAHVRRFEAMNRLARARQELAVAQAMLEQSEAVALRQRREAWVKKHRPGVVQELEHAQLAYNAGASNPLLTDPLREQLQRAQAAFAAACAEAPV